MEPNTERYGHGHVRSVLPGSGPAKAAPAQGAACGRSSKRNDRNPTPTGRGTRPRFVRRGRRVGDRPPAGRRREIDDRRGHSAAKARGGYAVAFAKALLRPPDVPSTGRGDRSFRTSLARWARRRHRCSMTSPCGPDIHICATVTVRSSSAAPAFPGCGRQGGTTWRWRMEAVLPAVAALLLGVVVLFALSRRRAGGSGDRARRVEEALARARDKQRLIGGQYDEEGSGRPPAV